MFVLHYISFTLYDCIYMCNVSSNIVICRQAVVHVVMSASTLVVADERAINCSWYGALWDSMGMRHKHMHTCMHIGNAYKCACKHIYVDAHTHTWIHINIYNMQHDEEPTTDNISLRSC